MTVKHNERLKIIALIAGFIASHVEQIIVSSGRVIRRDAIYLSCKSAISFHDQ